MLGLGGEGSGDEFNEMFFDFYSFNKKKDQFDRNIRHTVLFGIGNCFHYLILWTTRELLCED